MRILRLVIVLLSALLVFSMLNIALSTLIPSSNKNKTDEASFLVSAQSSGVQPDVTRVWIRAGGTSLQTDITGTFRNNEDVDVYGVATATLTTRPGESPQIKSSERTLLPAKGTVDVTITYSGVPFQNYYSTLITFTAEPIAAPTGGGLITGTQSPFPGGTVHHANTSGTGSNFASIGVPIIAVAVIAVGLIGGFLMVKKTRISEQKVRRFTSYEYQDWVMQRLGAHASSVLDSRKGIDGFTGDNLPVSIKQSDNVGRLQVDGFMNALTQTRARNGVVIAFGFDKEAYTAVNRAAMNRISIKLVTVKELIDHKDTILL